MKYLADENIEYPVIGLLKQNGIEVIAVRDIMKGATDTEIIHFALKNNYLIITSDKDFGELTFRLHKPSCGIILLRVKEADNKQKADILLKAIKTLTDATVNKFIVVDERKIRIRKVI